MNTYVFDQRWEKERGRLRSLEAIYDEASARYLASLGVTEGWRCLEAGCGAGGVALWLASRVGSTGQVVAIDLDTRFMNGHGRDNVHVRTQNILSGELEQEAFDLAHARAVVEHISEHRQALDRMISAMRPGGWLLIEDVDFGSAMVAALARYLYPAEHRDLCERVYRAVEVVFSAAGSDASFGSRLTGLLTEAGLEHVGAELHMPVFVGCANEWVCGTAEQLAPRIAETGLATRDDVDRFLALARAGALHFFPPVMVSAWGQRPGG